MAWSQAQGSNQTSQAVAVAGTPITLSYSSTPAQGSILIATVENQTNTQDATISDSNGNWTLIASGGNTAPRVGMYAQLASASQPTTISCSIPTTLPTFKVNIYEYSYGTPITALTTDGVNVTGSATTSVSDTSANQATINTTNADDLIVSTVGFAGTVTAPSESAGFTQGQTNTGAAIRLIDAYRFPNATGTYACQYNWTTARTQRNIMAAFQNITAVPTGQELSLMTMGIGN